MLHNFSQHFVIFVNILQNLGTFFGEKHTSGADLAAAAHSHRSARRGRTKSAVS
jgi:hypothetical protein